MADSGTSAGSSETTRASRYDEVAQAIAALLEGETDWIAAMATTACELHHAFAHYDWTGFYRAVSDDKMPRASAGPTPLATSNR